MISTWLERKMPTYVEEYVVPRTPSLRSTGVVVADMLACGAAVVGWLLLLLGLVW